MGRERWRTQTEAVGNPRRSLKKRRSTAAFAFSPVLACASCQSANHWKWAKTRTAARRSAQRRRRSARVEVKVEKTRSKKRTARQRRVSGTRVSETETGCCYPRVTLLLSSRFPPHSPTPLPALRALRFLNSALGRVRTRRGSNVPRRTACC